MPKVADFTKLPNFADLEESVLAYWQKNHVFEQSVEQRPADNPYVFYDGPPFATGLPHYGHLLASTTKDVIPRYQTMKGHRVERVWGWDCHGLPIENMIEKKLDIKGGKKGIEAFGIAAFNDACRKEVLRLDTEWEKIIGRLGRWVDFEHNYKTMDKTFMESVWWGFKQLDEKGLIYEGRKVILYCPRCSTPLSNFEIAMDNSYKEVTEPSTTYKYPVIGQPDTFLLAWSTTPWNKLATPALAVNPNLTYVKARQGTEYYIVAKDRISVLNGEYEVTEEMSGQDLESLQFQLHYDFYPEQDPQAKSGIVVADDFVTAEEGTGVVTLAAYGEDDYRVMKERGIKIIEHVDDEGRLKPEVTPWAGESILKVNHAVDQDLAQRGLIYDQRPHTHSVAVCYRCSTRLYYAPVPAWFVDIAQLRPKLIELNEKINWFPGYLKHGRFLKGLENAPDWNISRSRYWGTPMPVWRASGKNPQTRVIGSVAELQEWAVDPSQVATITDIHREFLDDVELWVDEARTVKGRRIPEVFDCWVESGSMPFASVQYPFANKDLFARRYPAQFISEYIAQTRAWFYTMHVISTGLFDDIAFENVLTTGTILAEDGSKMSKSKQNYPDPMVVIGQFGADSLRLYLMSSPVMKAENLNFSEKDVADIRRNVFVIWWNMLAFYQNLCNHQLSLTDLPHPTHVMDRWLMARLSQLVTEVTTAMDGYDVVKASRLLMSFVNELSTWYLRLSRDRLKQDATGEVGQVFGHALYVLAQLFAPLTPFFSETVHHTLVDESSSVHLTSWPRTEAYQVYAQPTLQQEMAEVQAIVEMGHAQRKSAGIKVRQPLANIRVLPTSPLSQADELAELIKAELNIKNVEWQPVATELTVELNLTLTDELRAEGEAREIMRTIQKLRKEHGLRPEDEAVVTLPSWPSVWQTEIEQRTKTRLQPGETLSLSQE